MLIFLDAAGLFVLHQHGISSRFAEVNSLDDISVMQVPRLAYQKALIGESWVHISNEFDRSKAALAWVMNRSKRIGNSGKNMPDEILSHAQSGGSLLCGDMAELYYQVLTAAGISARKVQLWRNFADTFDTHRTVEVKIGGKWIVIDPTFGVSPVDGDGQFLSAQDVKKRLLYGERSTFMKHGNYIYPAKIEQSNIVHWLVYQNVFIYDTNSLTNTITGIPPFRYYFHYRYYYERAENESVEHIKSVNQLFYFFCFVLPCVIIGLSILLLGIIRLPICTLRKSQLL